jgi:hypothetical protein
VIAPAHFCLTNGTKQKQKVTPIQEEESDVDEDTPDTVVPPPATNVTNNKACIHINR